MRVPATSPQSLEIRRFKAAVRGYHRRHGRHDLPWRKTTDPYRIAVSELMLQQTQVPRVIGKYKMFLRSFPTARSLAAAPLSRVLAAWSGLGYNRRAKFLHQLAREVNEKRKGRFPTDIAALESLPGIGPYTARAIAAFAYNEPTAFIETNIRTAFIHHFFLKRKQVSDKALLPLIEAALDRRNPRQWYAALMDYGASLKKSGVTAHRSSAQYKKQPAFAGSRRQLRGAIIRTLLGASATPAQLATASGRTQKEIGAALADLLKEKMVARKGGKFLLADR